MGDPSNRPEGTLTTPELIDAIEREFGLRLSREALRSWTRRETDPLPLAYQGKKGQPHLYSWVDFLEWFDRETNRQDQSTAAIAATDGEQQEAHIDTLDWHSARTISAREQAKRDILATAKAEERYGEIDAMNRIAEDRARQAVQQLLAIPSRLAPRLAAISDETTIDQLLDEEIRSVCQQIEAATLQSLATLDDIPAEAAP